MAQSSKLPTNPIGLYIPYWNPNGRVHQYPSSFNVLFLFHAPGDGDGTAGTFTYLYPSNVTNAQHRQDIQDARTAGKRVILSIGGAGGQVYITNQTRADAMVQSFKDENDKFGGFTRGSGDAGTTLYVDGIDLNNFEGGGSDPVWMSYAMGQLKSYYGADNFMVTAPPAAFELTSGGQGGSDRNLLGQIYHDGNLDWFCPQFYDPSDLNTLTRKREALDFYKATFTYNSNTITIPDEYVGVGMALINTDLAYPDNDLASRNTATDARDHFSTLVSDGRAPKGGFLWATSINKQSDFDTTVSPVMTNYVESGPTYSHLNGISLATFASTYSHLNGYSLASGLTINGVDIPAPAPTYLTPTLIASTHQEGGGAVTTPAIDTTGANFLVVGYACQDSYTLAPTDSAGNAWTQLTSYTQGNVRVRLFYAKGATTSATHTVSAGASVVGTVFFAAFSNVETGAFTVQQNGANAFDTSLATGAITPNTDKSLVIVQYGINGAGVPISIDNGFTELEEQDFVSGVAYGGMMAYKVVDPAASTSAIVTRTNSNGQAVTIASFDAATS